ncbi:MAG: ATP-dependent helicase [Lachnospiraceae bacterium]|nr:ATP-dependent helicase [Lachnospiraceae bacterium]
MSFIYDKNQEKAIRHFKGPCLCIAGPGSGKTAVITARIKYLIDEMNVSPTNILVITFTKAAAVQMKQRFQQSIGGRSARVTFGTFHAIFFTILKYAYHYTADNIIKEDLKRQILKDIISKTDLEIQDENEFINDIEAEISRVKGENMELSNYYSPNCSGEIFRKIFNSYNNALERRSLIDFDDMLIYCYELLSQRQDILRMWQKQYPFILIDEFQDINKVQYDVVKLLAKPYNNLFIVGDDDQSIYGFRGARPDIMQQFLKDYKDAVKYTLSINYRCSGNIVKAAGLVIKNNKNRFDKEITANNPDGEIVDIQEFGKLSEENDVIRNKIMENRNNGMPYGEMAVLFRTNTQARALTSKLMEYNIPFVMKERIPNIYDHWIARDIFTYIKVALGSRERAAVMRIINRPKRYVHRNAFSEPYVDFEELKHFYEDKEWMVERIEQLEYDLKMLSTLKPYAAINFIRCGIGYDDYIREYADYRGIRADDMINILDELQEEAKNHSDFDEWFDYIQQYGEELKEQAGKSQAMLNGQEPEDAVVIMTMHGAKGLEYECVFIPDVNEGVTPHNKAVLDADMEEERRMFYVAMTRAKHYLHIYYVKERFNKEVDVSRFVEEIVGEKLKKGSDMSADDKSVEISSDKKRNKCVTNKNIYKLGKDYRYGETNLRYKKPE